jgi:hypothetical protein
MQWIHTSRGTDIFVVQHKSSSMEKGEREPGADLSAQKYKVSLMVFYGYVI